MKEYRFYGWENADVTPVDEKYKMIKDARELYDLLSDGLWCRESCAPRMRGDWSEENKTLGQCSITSFLVQDIFGGVVRGIPLENGYVHCFNDIDGHVFDLTSEQFGNEKLDYNNNTVQKREDHFFAHDKLEKLERYQCLKGRLDERLSVK